MTQQLTQPQQSQQYQPQQQSQGTSTQSGMAAMGSQQMSGQGMSGQGTSGGTLPQQYRQTLDTVAQAVQVCGWCADQCIQQADPMMIECIRMCEDVVEIGEALLAVAPRSSYFTADLAATFAQAAQACAQECGRHTDAHCQECAQILPEAAQSAQQLGGTGTMGGTQTKGGMGQSMGGMGGQQLSQ